MRLTVSEQKAIKQILYAFDLDAQIYLFGSRVNDQARGGDIDLLILSKKITFADKIKILMQLEDALGEQKIDLLVAPDLQQPFVQYAMSQGIRL